MAFTEDSNQLLVAIKSYARGNALPLDNSEVYASKAEAESYAASAIAYAGQTIKVLENEKYNTYVLNPKKEGGFSLTRVGVDESVVTQIETLQTDVAINTANITAHDLTIEQNKKDIAANKEAIEAEITRSSAADTNHENRIKAIEDDYLKLADKTELETAISDVESRANTYADTAVANLVDGAPDTLNTLNELAEALKDNKDIVSILESSIATKANASDLNTLVETVAQNKTDAETAIEALQNRATTLEESDESILLNISNLEKLIEKNASDIEKEQGRAENAESELQTLIEQIEDDMTSAIREINESLAEKALAVDLTTLEGRVSATEQTLNTKVDTSTLNQEISELEQVIATQSTNLTTYIENRLDIDENTTVKAYINAAIGSGGTASAEAIAKAKQEAIDISKEYTNTQLSWQSYNPIAE